MYYLQSRYYDPEVGRFINADAFAATGQGVLGNNMFAYCGNNPTFSHDPTGTATALADPNATYFEDVLPGGGGGAILLGGITIGVATGYAITSFGDALWDRISRSYARAAKRTYRSPEEVHHLVAREALNAAPAAAILDELLPDGVENPINKMSIKTGLHRRLHTNLYYGIANAMVITAYYSSEEPAQQQMNVVVVLGLLRGIVAYLNAMAPY